MPLGFARLLVLCAGLVGARAARDWDVGLATDASSSLPVLSLPYGRFRAAKYDSKTDIYHFANIRYAAPPTGDLRWAKPQPPAHDDAVQDGKYGPMCYQALPPALNVLGKANRLGALAALLNGIVTTLVPFLLALLPQSEDCLFLDLYVPGSQVRSANATTAPVIVWTYGGGYIIGSKDQLAVAGLYDGTGPTAESGNKVIFVTYNYRIGSFGFLAGKTMEAQGLPNAGLYDQRAVYEWVRDNIHLVGGDADRVTAMGESAGAGSILHHITAFGGKLKPLFRRAVVQSVASELLIDRNGIVESLYTAFAQEAGCADLTVECLRRVDAKKLQQANVALVQSPPNGAFAPGPAADGTFVRQMPALELASGNYAKDLDGLVISHVADEPRLFVTGDTNTDSKFVDLVSFVVPNYAPGVLTRILEFFPSPKSPNSPYTSEVSRAEAWLKVSNFVCNYRYLTNAFVGKTWNLQYSVGRGLHGSDLIATFANNGPRNQTAASASGRRAQVYQSYLTSFAIAGDPNTLRLSQPGVEAIGWPHPSNISGEMLSHVLNVNDTGLSLIEDEQALKSQCDFFLDVQKNITVLGSYQP